MLLLLVCMEGLQGSLYIFSLTTSIHTHVQTHAHTPIRLERRRLEKIGLTSSAI